MASSRGLHNAFCDAWGIEVPIFLAGMGVGGRATPPALVAAVSQAGGLGVLGCSGLSPEETRRRIRAVRALTDKPFGVDLLLPARIADAPPTRSALPVHASSGKPSASVAITKLGRKRRTSITVLNDRAVDDELLARPQRQFQRHVPSPPDSGSPSD